MAANISAERLALVEKCLDEGWPFLQITQTHGISASTLRRHFPGRGMPLKDAAELGYRAMKASKRFRNVNHM